MSKKNQINRFSAKKVGEVLANFLEQNLDEHQKNGQFVEGCLQCEKCRLIREIASNMNNETVNRKVLGKPFDKRLLAHRAYSYSSEGRVLVRDWDKRVSGRVRSGGLDS